MGNERIRDQICMKESFGCGNPDDERSNNWPTEERLPGFRDFAEDFFQVMISLWKRVHNFLTILEFRTVLGLHINFSIVSP